MRLLIGLLLLVLPELALAISSGSGSNLTIQNGVVTIVGTSGGVLYFSAANTIGTSAALTTNGVVLGGGAGGAPTSTSAGTANQVFRVPSGGAPAAFGSIDLSQGGTSVANQLPEANGGTNADTHSGAQGGVFWQNASSTAAVSAAGTSGQCLKSNGTSAPSWSSCSSAPVTLGMGTGMPVTASTTVYISPVSNADSTEKNVQMPIRSASTTYSNLFCSTTTPPGIASGTMFVVARITTGSCVTAAAAACTSTPTANTGAGCSVTSASTTAQATCTDTGNTSPAQNECLDWCVTPGAGWATTAVNCTVERTA